jgi:glycine/D-amino acid oxidase-like deaminating enzyme
VPERNLQCRARNAAGDRPERLNVKQYPYWWDSLPGSEWPSDDESASDRPRAEDASLPPRADVVVIGAGYTGLSAARQLARGSASVVVLERHRAGWGASSRNGGQVLTGLKLEPAALVAHFGETRARALFDASIESIGALEQLVADERMECELEQSGHVLAACTPSHFKELGAEQQLLARVFRHRVELVSEQEQRTEIGSTAYHGLLVDERSLAINPALYVDGLTGAARRAGAAIVERTAVTAVSRSETGWTVRTTRGSITGRELLVATNGYASAATPWLQRRFIPIGSFIIATEPLEPAAAGALIPKRRMVFDSRHFLHYFRLTRDHRLLFGGRAEFSSPTADTTARCAEILRRDMVTLFPSLATTTVEYTWSGYVAYTRDQIPHAGRLHDAFYAGGYCGHGIAMATHLGSLVARRIAGERFEHPFFDDRFPAIPLYYGKPWFLPIVGAYFKLLDWIH